MNLLNIKNFNCFQIDSFKNLKKNSFLISNYAFSEITHELQKEYINKIINPYTKYGFLTWNFIKVYEFVDQSVIHKITEYPRNDFNNRNFYVYFHPKFNLLKKN